MSITYSTILSILISPVVIFVSLLFGISLIGKNPKEIIKPLTMSSVAISLLYICSELFLPKDYYLWEIGFLVVFVYVFKISFKLSYPFSIVVVLLSSIVFMFHVLLRQMTSHYLSPEISKHYVFTDLLCIVIYAALGMIMFSRKVTIFSNRADTHLISEGSLGRKMVYSLFPTICTLSVMLIWLLYCVKHLSVYAMNQQLIMFLFTVVTFSLFIYFIKIYSFYINDKIEGLMDKQNQEEMLNFMQVIRAQRHDFNFHLQAIFGMLENKRYSECADYVKAMVDEVSDMNEVLPLHHPAVSALLTTFREIATHKGIKLEIFIYYNLANIPCTVSEINKLIGNLVQNAIDEVEQHSATDRWVQVMILKRSGKSVIKVTNRSNKEMSSYKHIFTPGYSTKPSHEGIGLTTVQKLVAKYNGAVYPEFEEDVVHFIVQIPNAPQSDDEWIF